MKKTLRRQAYTYSYGINTHSLRNKTSYARYLPSHNISRERIIRIRDPTDEYKVILKRTKGNIYPNNMVKKCSYQAVSKGCELEPEYSKRFIIQATLEILDKEVPIRLLVDSGASGPILHEDFVRKNRLLVKKRKLPKQVKNANEEPIPNAGTHYTEPTVLVIGQHAEDMVWEVGMIESQIDRYLPVLWLQKHNPSINWETGTLKWRSAHC